MDLFKVVRKKVTKIKQILSISLSNVISWGLILQIIKSRLHHSCDFLAKAFLLPMILIPPPSHILFLRHWKVVIVFIVIFIFIEGLVVIF